MMPGTSGIAVLLAVNVLLLVGASVALAVLYRRTVADERGRGEWYEEAASLAREVERAASSVDPPVDRSRVQRRVVPLSTRLKSHARDAPRGVDADVARAVHDLGVDCYRIGMEHTERRAARTGVFIEDELEELRVAAGELAADASDRADGVTTP